MPQCVCKESGAKFIGCYSTFSYRPQAFSIVAFSQPFSAVVTDELMMMIFRSWQAQQSLQNSLNVSRTEKVHSSRHTSHALQCIVMDHGQMVA